ncbi:MAG: metal ABC transporter solute-binding protein, Zn/Mn family [Thermoguttaceae bacterium]
MNSSQFCRQYFFCVKHIFFLIVFSGFAVFVTGCNDRVKNGENDRPVFVVSVEPHAFLVEKIGGKQIHVEVLVPAGKEPEHYEATPKKIAMLLNAKTLFRTGMPFEEMLLPKLKSLSNNLKIVDLRENIPLRQLELHGHRKDESESEHVQQPSNISVTTCQSGCTHGGLDPHIWFAVSLLKQQSDTICRTLIEVDPTGEEVYKHNLKQLHDEIDALEKHCQERLTPFKNKTIFAFHPSYGYFCDEFGLQQHAIEYEGKSPSSQQIIESISIAKNDSTPPIVFIQPEFNEAPAKALAEAVGGAPVIHSALNRDIFHSIKQFVDAITSQ